MLDFLKVLTEEEFDAYFFLPGPKKDTVHIEGATYKNPGIKVGGSDLGDEYHVILFKDNTEDDVLDNVDRFDAVFAAPLEYISELIPAHWFGVLARKTTTSSAFIQACISSKTASSIPYSTGAPKAPRMSVLEPMAVPHNTKTRTWMEFHLPIFCFASRNLFNSISASNTIGAATTNITRRRPKLAHIPCHQRTVCAIK